MESTKALEVQAFLCIWMQTPITSDLKNLVTSTLYYMQSITSKVLSSGILCPEEGLVWVFSTYNIYALKNITSLYKLGSSAKLALFSFGATFVLQQVENKDVFWPKPPHCHSDLV